MYILVTNLTVLFVLFYKGIYSSEEPKVHQNIFAVQVPQGLEAANDVANKLGFTNRGQIGSLINFFMFVHPKIKEASFENDIKYLNLLISQREVSWAEQMHELKRFMRVAFNPARKGQDLQINAKNRIFENEGFATRSFLISDTKFYQQWYLYGRTWNGMDMNIVNTWQIGYTGKGIVIAIVDDALDKDHPDLKKNYDSRVSTDLTRPIIGSDRLYPGHGTVLAGIIAALSFNGYCNTGIAFNAGIGGINILGEDLNDATEAAGLSFNLDLVDIYSISWGPDDNGIVLDGPGVLTQGALSDGTNFGRGGKGAIYVTASGNGGINDCCGADGYATNINTITVSSATKEGRRPWFLEECSAALATTYGPEFSGIQNNIVIRDNRNKSTSDYSCASEHAGTSASAAVASGIIALTLEANPTLSWRDMQHLIVLTSQAAPLIKEPGWLVNGVNKPYSHAFGFGLMDAEQLAMRAERWTTVPKQRVCVSNDILRNITVSKKSPIVINVLIDGCLKTLNEIHYLEHVQLKMNMFYKPRGNVKVALTSPMGTTSVMLKERANDSGSDINMQWPFMSVHFWGEFLKGQWKIHISTNGNQVETYPGLLMKTQLIFYGTLERPVYVNHMDFIKKSMNNKNVFLDMEENNMQKVYKVSNTRVFKGKHNMFYGDNESKVKEKAVEKCKKYCPFSQYCLKSKPKSCIDCKLFSTDNIANEPLVCWFCGNKCDVCSDSNQNDCRSSLQSLALIVNASRNTETCPPHFFEVPELVTCSECSPNCQTCNGMANQCTSCANNLVSFDSKCYASCPQGTFKIEDGKCATCHPNCETCIQYGKTHCVTCKRNSLLHDGSCLRSCPKEYYPDNGECNKCPLGCRTCHGKTCKSCKDKWILLHTSCVYQPENNCAKGEFFDGNECEKCDDSCDKCNGPTNNDCIACESHMNLEVTRCVAKCSEGYFISADGCIPCSSNCEGCLSKKECNNCKVGLVLQGMECRVSCAQGYFAVNAKCETCFPTCATCSGPRNTQCVSCPRGWNLIDGQCQKSCPNSYFQAEFGCNQCFRDCRTCQGPEANECTSCPLNFILHKGKCLTCVRDTQKTYYNNVTEICEPCHSSCETCGGPLESHCTDCKRPYTLDRSSGHCLPCCSDTLIILESVFHMSKEDAILAMNKPYGCCICENRNRNRFCNASSTIADIIKDHDLNVYHKIPDGNQEIATEPRDITTNTTHQVPRINNQSTGIHIVFGVVCLLGTVICLRKFMIHIQKFRNRNVAHVTPPPLEFNPFSFELDTLRHEYPVTPINERRRRFWRTYLNDGTVSE